jgi:hypothetical protein
LKAYRADEDLNNKKPGPETGSKFVMSSAELQALMEFARLKPDISIKEA